MRYPEKVLLANNIIGLSKVAGIKYNGDSRIDTNEKYNCYFENSKDILSDNGIQSIGPYAIHASPGFVDIAKDDLRLSLNSPCLEAGILMPGLKGFLGKEPKKRTSPNIGAYQGDGIISGPDSIKPP
jgi:hypothetical protein